jgi:hypothetical protein
MQIKNKLTLFYSRAKRLLEVHSESPVRPISKALVFGLLLLYVQASQYGAFPLMLFFAWSLYVYLTPVARTYTATTAWITLVCLSLLMPSRFTLVTPGWAPHHVLPEYFFALIFAVLCFIYVSIAIGSIGYKERWYEVLHAGLVWGVSLLFTAGQAGMHPIRATIISAVLLGILAVEYLRMHGQKDGGVIRFSGVIVSMQFFQLAWAIRFLPLSAGYSSAILALVAIIGTSVTEQYLRGTLRGRFIRYAVSFLLMSAVFIALFSRWTI